MESLHPGAKWLFRIQTYLGTIFLFFLFGIFSFPAFIKLLTISFWFTIILPLVILFLVILIGEIFVRWAYRNWKYEFTHDNLRIEKGIIIKKYKSIPYERIQNVDITRGIIARIVGFSTIDIQTAGYSAYGAKGGVGMSEGHLPAVSIEGAEHIREFLMKKITKNRQGL